MSPSDPVCPGNRVIFTCQQPGTFTRWRIMLPSGTIQHLTFSTQLGSILTFANDPDFNFEVHVVSNSSDILTTELQVTAVKELNGVTVECFGSNESRFTSTINVTSVGESMIYYNFFININLKTPQLLQVESWKPISSSQKMEPQ